MFENSSVQSRLAVMTTRAALLGLKPGKDAYPEC
jgi:hypothetical protein